MNARLAVAQLRPREDSRAWRGCRSCSLNRTCGEREETTHESRSVTERLVIHIRMAKASLASSSPITPVLGGAARVPPPKASRARTEKRCDTSAAEGCQTESQISSQLRLPVSPGSPLTTDRKENIDPMTSASVDTFLISTSGINIPTFLPRRSISSSFRSQTRPTFFPYFSTRTIQGPFLIRNLDRNKYI